MVWDNMCGTTTLCIAWNSLKHPRPGSKQPFPRYLQLRSISKKTTSDTHCRILFINLKIALPSAAELPRPHTSISAFLSLANS